MLGWRLSGNSANVTAASVSDVVRETLASPGGDGAAGSDDPAARRADRLGAARDGRVGGGGGKPTRLGLIGLDVAGLVVVDARPSRVRSSERLPARSHDALSHLERTTPVSTRALLAGPIRLARRLSGRLGTAGYPVVDDVVIEEPFAQGLRWSAWTSSDRRRLSRPAARRAGGPVPSSRRWWLTTSTSVVPTRFS